jgi:AcrR family transcriptional regulator
MADVAGEERKRSALAQERSRDTRRRLVRAAMLLWDERGYDTGIETTTVAEIAGLAGVTKATFYLHFTRKEDILHEMARETAVSFDEDAEVLLRKQLPTTQVLDRLHASLATRLQSIDRAAVVRSMAETRRQALLIHTPATHSFDRTYVRVLRYAQTRGDLPASMDLDDVSRVLQAVVMDTMEEWATGDLRTLRAPLIRRTTLVLAGVAASA